MRTVDTSAWIEWLAESATGDALAEEWPDLDRCVVPTIVQLELVKWLSREMSEDVTDQVTAHTRKCVVVDLTTDIALVAAEQSGSHRLSTADAVIYATALVTGSELITCDAHFKGLPHVLYFAKT